MLAQFAWIVAGIVVLTAIVALTVSLLAGLLKPGLFSSLGDSTAVAAEPAGPAPQPALNFRRAAPAKLVGAGSETGENFIQGL